MINKIKKFLSNIKLSGIPAIIGFLGAYAGSEGTSILWRRCGIPVIFVICALIETKSLWVIALMSIWGCLSIGYGIPDDDYPENPDADEGSTIGHFWTMLIRKKLTWDIYRNYSHKWADYFTRGTVGLSIATAFLVIPILKGNWLWYILGSVGIILVYAVNSWRGYGEFEFKRKGKIYHLLKVDFVTYGVLGICGLLIIYKG